MTNNTERKAYWHLIRDVYPPNVIEKALNYISTEESKVIQLHYLLSKSLKQISQINNYSVSKARRLRSGGMDQLHKFFEQQACEVNELIVKKGV